MMTSVGNERTRGTREKTQISTPQTQPQKQVQATAEQIRLAQMIYDKNDADFEDKVKQLMEVTGKNQDECLVALHDCNGDVNRAINILLEGNSDTTSWETVGGKKKIGKESSENKENREKRGDREVSRGRGTSNRRGRGGSRGREFRAEENGVDSGPGDRPADRGRRGRGRGFGGRGRGRGAGRFSAQGMGTFNPADYTEPSTNDGFGVKSDVWETGQTDGDDGTGAWRNSIEEWTAEDWNEDLSETKVFTASSVPTENHITAGQSIDLVALLQKPQTNSTETESAGFESSSQQNFGQALVFTNSQHSSQMTSTASSSSAVNSFTPQSLSSVLGSGFGELGTSKLTNSAGAQILEQLKSPGLGQFSTQNSQQSGSNAAPASSWDIKPSVPQSSVLSQFDFKSQPEPSPVLSQLAQRQQQHQVQPVPVPPPGLETFTSQVKLRETSPVDSSTSVGKMLQLPSVSLDSQAMSAQQTHQQKHIKPQKRRIPPTSKIPASAVEMPGSADVTGLNVQFGALEFGSEPSLPEFGSNTSPDTGSQTPSNLYSKTISESLNTSLPISSTVQEPSYTASVITTSSHNSSSQSASPVTISSSSSSSYDQTSVHSRIGYQSSMTASEVVPVTNGHNGIRAQVSLNTTPSVPSAKSENSQSLTSVGSLSSPPSTTSSLLPPASQHTSAVSLSNLPQPSDLSNSSLSQLNSTLSGHQNSLPAASVLSSAVSHTHTSVESTVTLQPSTTFSTAPTSATSTTSSVVSMASSMNTTNSLGLSVPSVSVPAATTRTAPLVSSGKAPPNLPQGVPPLLHNQYIVGPGGLLPAYPIYGYDDLQMLQSRLPMDYYGITFPAPATLTGRDGGLASNPYSGVRTLIENIIKQVDNPRQSKQSIYENAKSYGNRKSEVFAPLAMDTGSFAFTAFAGVPALEFSFVERSNPYKYLDTKMDTYENLNSIMDGRLPAVALTLAQAAGLSLMKLSHDRILPLDYTAYNTLLLEHLISLKKYTSKLEPRGLTLSWLYSARGDYARATDRLKKAIGHSDLHNERMIQFFNVRIMRVEFYFLSQYVSAINYPYRHILIGRGEHTLEALMEQLGRDQIDSSEVHKQIALFTWTLVGAANALSGEVWEVQRNF